ncbi:uncharacterized protein [Labrus bergylta]|uniref:uncharacterized protein n=1 Tax=Labrus bergylta TaxID=56723 RepID=UPI0009B48099|nr:uncharacterized protein LOC109976279 [Labrus bergylta]XP_020503655.1 uncharacterized protein LOC109994588 [Labrus bergylta]
MGSGTSRGKRVAPACVSEVNVAKAAGASPKQDSRAFKPLKIHGILRNARNRAQPDSHSEGHDSDFSREDDDVDAELDTVLADDDERDRASVKRDLPKKAAMRSKTYGLCHFRQDDEEEDLSPKDVNKRSNDAVTHFRKNTPASACQQHGFLTGDTLLDSVPTSGQQPTFGTCHSSSHPMPVILYDGSEEELMDTIVREFS